MLITNVSGMGVAEIPVFFQQTSKMRKKKPIVRKNVYVREEDSYMLFKGKMTDDDR